MRKQDQLAEITRLLRFQQSLLHLSARCAAPDPARKRPVSVRTRTLEQLARKIEAQAG